MSAMTLAGEVLRWTVVGGSEVCTAVLGSGDYETAIHGGAMDGQTWAWESRAEAEAGHRGAVSLCRSSGA